MPIDAFDAKLEVTASQSRQRKVRPDCVVVAKGLARLEHHARAAIEQVVPEPAAKREPRPARLVGVAVTGKEPVVRSDQPPQPAVVGIQEQLLESSWLVGIQLLRPLGPLLLEDLGASGLSDRDRWNEPGYRQQQSSPSQKHATKHYLNSQA